MANRNVGTRTIGAAITVALTAGVGATAATAAPRPADRSSVAASTSTTSINTVSAAEWRLIATRAARAGDAEGAAAARQMAHRAEGGIQPHNIFTKVAKKALVTLLRHGGSKLPGKLKGWAGKMADVIDATDDLQEIPLAAAFMKVGMPPDLARYAAQWCVTFLGF